MLRVIFFIIVLLMMISCESVSVSNFVHDSTEEARRNLQWSKPNPSLGVKKRSIIFPFVVPDFYQFWPGYSSDAYFYIVLSSSDAPELISLTIDSDTNEHLDVRLNLPSEGKPLDDGLVLYRYRVLDLYSSDKFLNASNLTVTLKWKTKLGKVSSDTFNIKKLKRKEIVWIT